jgi:pimeloyl-ACP methyl ester carboxylesterase
MPALGQSVDLGGGRHAAYEVIGDGPPLLYFQGGPGFSAALLRPDAELLADSFSVYLIDPAGSGGSTPPSDPSQYDHIGHARFYDEVRQALDVPTATIMGISFGGVVALTYAALYPDSATRCIAPRGRSATRSRTTMQPPRCRRSWRATHTSLGIRRLARFGMNGPTGCWRPMTLARSTR